MAAAPQPERFFRRLSIGLFAVAGLAFLLQAGLAIVLTNELTEVESIIAVQARMLADGAGLYTELDAYPYTVSPYGPIFYAASAVLGELGFPYLLGGRLVSLAALIACIALIALITQRLTADKWAAGTAVLLALVTANLVKWGTTAQTDVLALAFALAGFERYTAWRKRERATTLVWAGVFAACAIFTKQSFIASAAAITILVFARDRRTGVLFGGLLGFAGVGTAVGVDVLTGGYFDHGIRANMNMFVGSKLADQAKYFAFVASPLVALAFAPALRLGRRAFSGFHVYLALAFAILCATAGKMGADLNYQLETFALLSIAAGIGLHQLDFFRLCFQSDKSWVTLLQIPLLFFIVLNVALTAKTALGRVVRDRMWQEQAAKLAPYLESDGGRVLTVEINPLAVGGRRIEVEPLIYTDLVRLGLVDPTPVRRDLENGGFSAVILYEDLFDAAREPLNGEMPTLPKDHLDAVRSAYRLVEHIDGPLAGGVYVYQPNHVAALTRNRLEQARVDE